MVRMWVVSHDLMLISCVLSIHPEPTDNRVTQTNNPQPMSSTALSLNQLGWFHNDDSLIMFLY